ncbi:LacI family DNA-binding transcriptional regulator [Blautia schinkii]|nr:LacI family DNA-binding transcriptional regulator [Blautia schinkii]
MATIKDIAKIAGVSTSTVSHVVNHTRYVSPELVEKVEKAIQELDQLPNFIVKKTKGYKNPGVQKYVLLLRSENSSLFQRQIEESMEALFTDAEYTLLAVGYDKSAARLEIVKTMLMDKPELCGVIAFPDEMGVLDASFFQGASVPVVLIGKDLQDFNTDVLYSDTFEGSYRAVKHLIKNGHEHIAFLGSWQDYTARRLEGYKKALEDYHIRFNEELVFSKLNTEEEVFTVLEKMMGAPVIPTAVIAANSAPLIPLLKYMNAHNILIPKDISVVSLNDFEWASLLTPEMTCIDKQPEEFAALSARILLGRIQKGEAANAAALEQDYQHITLSTQLNVRGSTCGIGRGPFGEKAENADSLILSEAEKEMIRRKNYTAAISFHYTGKAWMRLQENGIKKIFGELGISLIAVTDAHFDASLQCKQLESIRFLDPDILIAIPVDSRDTAEAFREIAKSDTKLVLITNIPEGITSRDYVSCISVNEHSHGRNMGHGLGEYMVHHGLRHAGLIRHGDQNFFATKQRDDAAEQVLAEEFPELHICGEMNFLLESEVYKKTLDFVNHHPEVEALYVSWDGPALEVIKALTDMNRTDIAVVTGDLDYSIAMNMAKGGMVKMLSAQCPYEQGEAIALAAANALLGKKTPSFIGIEPVCVGPDNLLKTWGNVFREEPPAELRNAIRQNPNHISHKKESLSYGEI